MPYYILRRQRLIEDLVIVEADSRSHARLRAQVEGNHIRNIESNPVPSFGGIWDVVSEPYVGHNTAEYHIPDFRPKPLNEPAVPPNAVPALKQQVRRHLREK